MIVCLLKYAMWENLRNEHSSMDVVLLVNNWQRHHPNISNLVLVCVLLYVVIQQQNKRVRPGAGMESMAETATLVHRSACCMLHGKLGNI